MTHFPARRRSHWYNPDLAIQGGVRAGQLVDRLSPGYGRPCCSLYWAAIKSTRISMSWRDSRGADRLPTELHRGVIDTMCIPAFVHEFIGNYPQGYAG